MNATECLELYPIRAQKGHLREYLGELKNGTEFKIKSLPQFNRVIGGMERQKLVIVGARPSECKSAFCFQLAYDFSKNFKVLYVSLEMTIKEALFRMLCYKQKITNTSLYNGEVDAHAETIEEFYKILERDQNKLIFTDNIGTDWDGFNGIMEKLKDDKPDIVFVDYLQCIKTKGKSFEAIADYIRRIRELAVRQNILIVLASQINRANIADGKEPTMEGLKGHGKIEEQADKIVLLHYPCKHNHKVDIDKFKIIIAKNKNGMTGYVDMRINPGQYRIYEDKSDLTEYQQAMGDLND